MCKNNGHYLCWRKAESNILPYLLGSFDVNIQNDISGLKKEIYINLISLKIIIYK